MLKQLVEFAGNGCRNQIESLAVDSPVSAPPQSTSFLHGIHTSILFSTIIGARRFLGNFGELMLGTPRNDDSTKDSSFLKVNKVSTAWFVMIFCRQGFVLHCRTQTFRMDKDANAQ